MGICYLVGVICKKNHYQENLNSNTYFTFNFTNKRKARKFLFSKYFDLIFDCFENKIIKGNDSFPLYKDNNQKMILKKLEEELATTELSSELALSFLDNNVRVYQNILKRYYETYYNCSSVINNLYEEKNFKAIREYVHKIKGISLNIGGQKLYEIASLLEERLSKGKVGRNEIIFFIKYHARIIKYCEEIVIDVQ